MENNLDNVCKSCGICNGTLCFSINKEMEYKYNLPEKFPQNYNGIRFTSDAMDCSIPISIDSHSGCSFSCLYCFSNNLMRAPDKNQIKLQKIIKEGSFYSEFSIKKLEKFLARERKDIVSLAMYNLLDIGSPVQLGALGDPFDNLELHSGWAKKAIPLFIKYNIPVRIGTKGGVVLQRKEYLKLFEKNPDQFWFAFSITCNSDEIIRQIDINAPSTSDRLAAMKKLTKIGCNASLRFRPFLPGISDSYPGEPQAWKTLILRAKESGARAISFEYIFLPSNMTGKQKAMHQLLFKVMKNPKFAQFWMENSNKKEVCRRGKREIKEEITLRIKHLCHKIGMQFGCSDPHFKELNDTGSCCGMPEEHPYFGNWSRRQMTEVIVQARKAYNSGEELLINYNDWKPKWAHKIQFREMVSIGNWHNYRIKKNTTFGDHIRERWNNPSHPRGPYIYFDKALVPIGLDRITGDLVYVYKRWKKMKRFSGIVNDIFT